MREPDEKQPDESQDWLPFRLGFGETATILTLINALFIFFVWVQLAYLFGGRANITIEGFTYAEYARRGFFELVTVAVLTFMLVLGLHWFSHRQTNGQTRWFNGLSSVMASLVLVLLASAFLRLQLYELTYGFDCGTQAVGDPLCTPQGRLKCWFSQKLRMSLVRNTQGLP